MADTSPPSPEPCVLIVEDDHVLRQTCALTLRSRRLRVLEAENGEDGLALFAANDVHAILMDAIMPVMDGFETCRRIRSSDRGETIPILMITGLDDAASVNMAYDVGATDFIPKPVHLGILAQRLLRLIEANQLEEKLRNKRLQFDFIYQALPDAAVFSRLDHSVLLVNPSFCEQFGYQGREVINRNVAMLYEEHNHYLQSIQEMENQPVNGRRWRGEIRYRRKDGSVFTGETTLAFVHDEDGRNLGYLRLIRDVSERLAREREIATKTAEMQAITEYAPEMIARMNRFRRYIYVNRAFQEFVGEDACAYIGRTHEELGFPEALCRKWNDVLDQVLSTGNSVVVELVVARRGENRTLQSLVAPERHTGHAVETVIVFSRDITELKHAEQERVMADRLKTLGVLAGGVAHDFNNFITALTNHVTLAQMELPPQSQAAHYLAECQPALEEAMHLSQQLLTFAKGGQPIKKLCDIERLVRNTAQFALRGLRSVPHYAIARDLWPAEVDEGQIVQVVTNLLINADQAMPSGGRIHLRVDNLQVREREGRLQPGPYVRIEVEDTGSGIPPENLNRIFDPYFTTKARGNGLGLATVFSILDRHSGHIQVRSQVGKGSCFTCLIPALPGRPVQSPDAPIQTQGAGQGRILILEDQDIIRKGLVRMLSQVGYEVVETVRGEDALVALQMAERAGRPFDLLFADMTIPGGLGGLEVVHRLRQGGSRIRAIVSSGYAEDPVMARPGDFGFDGVLPKPFKRDDLLRVVSDVLRLPRRDPAELAPI